MTTRLTTPFGAQTTANEVLRGVDLTGKRAIVTGGASGIGVETARALANVGAEVTIAVRNLETAAHEKITAKYLELADLDSVTKFVNEWDGPLHILVNNAGMMASPEAHTPEGWEMQFATNHLGHFALATGLYPALKAAGGARVVSVSSSAHQRSPVVFDDIHFAHRAYEPWAAYGQSKTANVLFAVEAARRWADDGILINALHPGGIRTNLQRYVSEDELNRLRGNSSPAWKSPEQGAATSVLAAASPLLDGVSGRYLEDCNEAEPHQEGSRRGVAAYALDPDAAARLWIVSEEMLDARLNRP
jgi:NAD(P)-dependent dehydrogenase (short-subunit alcohol dehydrogenase family)